jgi:hypothetical protein
MQSAQKRQEVGPRGDGLDQVDHGADRAAPQKQKGRRKAGLFFTD